MVEVKDGPFIIRYDGLFDFQGLYETMMNWLKRYRFWVKEITYKHKVPSPFGAEQEIEWDASRNPTFYYSYGLKILIKLWEMSDVEVVVDGKKKILTKARLEIRLYPYMKTDWQKRFEKNAFTRAMKSFLETIVIRKEIESGWWDPWYYRVWNFHAMIKKYLDMQTKWHEYAGYLGEER